MLKNALRCVRTWYLRSKDINYKKMEIDYKNYEVKIYFKWRTQEKREKDAVCTFLWPFSVKSFIRKFKVMHDYLQKETVFDRYSLKKGSL